MSGRAYERPPGDLTDLSVSRIRTVDTCGLKFKLIYVDGLPAMQESASTLFGNVVHDGVENWYGPEGSDNHRASALEHHFHKLWVEYLPAGVWPRLDRTIAAGRDLKALGEAIKISRPTLKAVHQTQDYLKSQEHKRFEDCREKLLQKCEKIEGMRWPKDEDPLVAYRKSMVIAHQLEARWKHLPRPLVVEHPFLIDMGEYKIKGRIDQIRRDPDVNGEPGPVELLDIKSGRQPLTQMEAFIQAFLYDEACHVADELPEPEQVTFWLARHDRAQRGRIDRERHRKLAIQIINGVARKIITGDWQPHYGAWCRWCDFRENCEQDIGLWPAGAETLEEPTSEVVAA